LTEQENTRETWMSDQRVVRAVCAFAFAAVAASLYGKAFPEKSADDRSRLAIEEHAASALCEALPAPHYSLSIHDDRSGTKIATASLLYQERVDTETTAALVRSPWSRPE
jgi:hypothetical protein